MKGESILRRAPSVRSIARFIVWYAAGAAIAGLLLLLDGFPYHPKSRLGWVVFFLAALPIMLVGEWVGDCLAWYPRKAGVEQRPEGSVSWGSIGYMLVAGACFVVLAGAIAWIWQRMGG
jgi:hypothetical protein